MNQGVVLNYAFVCDQAFFSEGRKLNIIGIFQNISGPTLPIIHPQLFIVANFTVDKQGEYTVQVKLKKVGEKKSILNPLNLKLKAEKDKSEVGLIGQLTNLKFEENGEYTVQLFINSELVKNLLINVSV